MEIQNSTRDVSYEHCYAIFPYEVTGNKSCCFGKVVHLSTSSHFFTSKAFNHSNGRKRVATQNFLTFLHTPNESGVKKSPFFVGTSWNTVWNRCSTFTRRFLLEIQGEKKGGDYNSFLAVQKYNNLFLLLFNCAL